MVNYLEKSIVAKRNTDCPRWGIAADGYTIRSGAPTSWLVKLEGETRWRRLMVLQFSNVGSCFLRIKGEAYFVRDCDIPG